MIGLKQVRLPRLALIWALHRKRQFIAQWHSGTSGREISAIKHSKCIYIVRYKLFDVLHNLIIEPKFSAFSHLRDTAVTSVTFRNSAVLASWTRAHLIWLWFNHYIALHWWIWERKGRGSGVLKDPPRCESKKFPRFPLNPRQFLKLHRVIPEIQCCL